MNQENKITLAAFYTALAASIYIIESLIPRPLPFLKFGLANVIILLLLYRYNLGFVLTVAVGKTILGSLIIGTLISPTTIMSLSGGLVALLIMFTLINMKLGLSLVGVSIAGAVFHNLTQLVVVRIILVQENKIFYLTSLLIILGIVTGIITGFLAFIINQKIRGKLLI